MFIEIIELLLAILGAIAAIWFIVDKIWPLRRIPWRYAQKAAFNITNKLQREGFSPTVLVGIGRGGAIMAAMISGCMGHRPLIVIDRKYTWTKGRRTDDMILKLRLPQELTKRVLLVAGEAHTGNTMRFYYNFFSKAGAEQIKRSAFYVQKGCTEPIEYVGFKSDRDLLMPWMFSKEYVRDSRGQEEALTVPDFYGDQAYLQAGELLNCFIVRHAESTDNASGDRYSGITESLLTDRGREQAKFTARELQGKGIGIIYTSPMKRATATAREIQVLTGAQVVIDNRLREIDYGEWEGYTRKEVFERWPELYKAYRDDPIIHTPPSGENPQKVLERLLDFWHDLKFSVAHQNTHSIALVLHNAVARILITHLSNNPLQKYRERRIDNCSVTKIVLHKSEKAEIEYENKTNHLST